MKKRSFNSGLMHSGNVPIVATIIVLIAFIAGLLVGSLMITKSFSGKVSLVSPMTGGYADGWNAAKKKLAEASPMMSNIYSLSGQVKAANGQEISFTTSLINPLDDESLKTRTAIVNGDTKITVYKLKSAEQIAADQKEGQAQLAKFQKDSSALNEEMMACNEKRMTPGATGVAEESSTCKAAQEELNKLSASMSQTQQKMDMYQKVENATLADVKEGWSISVTAATKKVEDNPNAGPTGMMSGYENIASTQKFIASSIDAREVQAAPVMPTAPTGPAVSAPVQK